MYVFEIYIYFFSFGFHVLYKWICSCTEIRTYNFLLYGVVVIIALILVFDRSEKNKANFIILKRHILKYIQVFL